MAPSDSARINPDGILFRRDLHKANRMPECLLIAHLGLPDDAGISPALHEKHRSLTVMDFRQDRAAVSYFRTVDCIFELLPTSFYERRLYLTRDTFESRIGHRKPDARLSEILQALDVSPISRWNHNLECVGDVGYGGTRQQAVGNSPRHALDSSRNDVVAIITRPMLGIVGQIGAQIEVPTEALSSGLTFPTIIDFPTATRSAIVVKSGKRRPDDAYAAVQYRKTWYWLKDNDANSKVAFTVVEILEALAQSSSSGQTPLVTIPAN